MFQVVVGLGGCVFCVIHYFAFRNANFVFADYWISITSNLLRLAGYHLVPPLGCYFFLRIVAWIVQGFRQPD